MSLDPKVANQLSSGAKALDVNLSSKQQSLLLAYLAQFIKWNTSYNLSSIRMPQEMVSKHLLDSLSVVNIVGDSPSARIIDVGTGGGLPGIPLAIMFPEKSFTLLDSAGKKTRFLQQLVHNLQLKNVNVVNKRVESYAPPDTFDIVISRAFADIAKMVRCCVHLLDDDGEFWAMKGVFPQDELSDLEKHYKVKTYTKLRVPSNISDSNVTENIGERCLIKIHVQKSE